MTIINLSSVSSPVNTVTLPSLALLLVVAAIRGAGGLGSPARDAGLHLGTLAVHLLQHSLISTQNLTLSVSTEPLARLIWLLLKVMIKSINSAFTIPRTCNDEEPFLTFRYKLFGWNVFLSSMFILCFQFPEEVADKLPELSYESNLSLTISFSQLL